MVVVLVVPWWVGRAVGWWVGPRWVVMVVVVGGGVSWG